MMKKILVTYSAEYGGQHGYVLAAYINYVKE